MTANQPVVTQVEVPASGAYDAATQQQHAEMQRVAMNSRSKAIEFLRDVKGHVNPEDYEEMLDILNSFRHRKMRADEVALASLRILRGHQHLLEAFYQFCPSARASVVEEEEEMEEAALRLTGQKRGLEDDNDNVTTDGSSSENDGDARGHAHQAEMANGLSSRSSAFSMPGRPRNPRSPEQEDGDARDSKGGSERVCFVNPATGQMLTGNRAPRRPETINKYLAEGWIPLVSERKRKAPSEGTKKSHGSSTKSHHQIAHQAPPVQQIPYPHAVPQPMDPTAMQGYANAPMEYWRGYQQTYPGAQGYRPAPHAAPRPMVRMQQPAAPAPVHSMLPPRHLLSAPADTLAATALSLGSAAEPPAKKAHTGEY